VNIKKTLVLFAVLVAGIIYSYTVEYRGKQNKARNEKTENKIFSFDPASIDKISITTDTKTTEIIRSGHDWKITSPVTATGDSDVINQLIRTAADGAITRTVDGDPRDFGLEPPTMRMEFHHGGAVDTLFIGSPSPTGSSIYIRTNKTGRAALINASFGSAIAKNLFQLRDKRLFRGMADEVDKFEITKSAFTLTVEKGKGQWNITSPIKAMADERQTALFLGRLMVVGAIAFPDTIGEKEAGLSPPRLAVAVWIKNAKQEIHFGNESTDQLGIYAKMTSEKQVAELPGVFFNDIPQTADALRDKNVSAGNEADVRKKQPRQPPHHPPWQR